MDYISKQARILSTVHLSLSHCKSLEKKKRFKQKQQEGWIMFLFSRYTVYGEVCVQNLFPKWKIVPKVRAKIQWIFEEICMFIFVLRLDIKTDLD